ncbi:MAG: 2-phospho-L-lactate transferase [Actinomycetota bacterium]|nr:2-phospho-L-lactate transferase [Actinomycetota bacterium]
MSAPSPPVVVLAGGTGGAKLARGMVDATGPGELVVIANTGDDIEIHGAYVSPDPDLVSFWLADRIDSRGWGLRGDTFAVMDGLRELGVDVWFQLGDRDLAYGLERAHRLTAGDRLTEAQAAITAALSVPAQVLPMSDQPVRTRVLSDAHWWGLQEFLIRNRGEGEITDVDFRGARCASPSLEVLEAIGHARTIIIGPSNPVISIGPILALPGLREAIAAAPAPVVAVSPIVAGEVLKGPTAACMRGVGVPVSAEGVAELYSGLIDGLVADVRIDGLPVLETNVLMDTAPARARVARETLEFALALG